ncbi:non-ribosomal peptide synthetase [Photorhabdus antumapuensis]|uniref:non-ribosomal peptide synthetase n=1 Tax=Photorhabdus antumapuensis TaxID=2862867 RepID=UPI001CEC9420|nr:non-ribosomal peptide synthetase [Photorhabdus antumapuensis]
MNLKGFIDRLSEQEVRLFVENGALKSQSAPGAITPEQGKFIKQNKQAIIDFLSYAEVGGQQKLSLLQRRHLTKAPLSFAQRRFWLVEQVSTVERQYKISTAFNLYGQFSLEAASQAMDAILKRHEILRTVYQESQGMPEQVVLDDYVFQIDKDTLADEVDQQQHIEDWLAGQRQRRFDLSRDLPLRVAYLASDLKSDTSDKPLAGVLFFDLHHIAADGWSLAILVDEFTLIYQQIVHGKPALLTELELQYSDYACWQNQAETQQMFDEQLQYWQQQLANLPLVHELPLDYARPQKLDMRSTTHTQKIPMETISKLKRLAVDSNATLFMLLHTAFAVMLGRYSDNPDVIIGTPITSRPVQKLESLIGCFLNTLVLRLDCTPTLTFNELLKSARQVHLDAQSNQAIPFELLVEKLLAEQSTVFTPLFQVLFSMQNYESQQLELADVEFEEVIAQGGQTQFDLTLTATEDKDGLSLIFEFNQGLFHPGTIARFAENMQLLLAHIAVNGDRPINQLAIVSEQEQAVLDKSHQSAWQLPEEQPFVHQLIQQRAAEYPERVAIRYQEQSLSFAELDARANQIAQFLLTKGADNNPLVAILMEPGIDFVVSMLAILKAGCAYLPLDPTYSVARLSFILADSHVGLVIVDNKSIDKVDLPMGSIGTILLNDTEIAAQARTEPMLTSSVTADSLAYVIYTSGSTGNPKGVMISHGALSASTVGRFNSYSIVPEKFLLVSSFAFDSSVPAIYWGLGSGATLHLMAPQDAKDASYVAKIIDSQQISHVLFIPSFYDAVLDSLTGHSLRKVICAGENLSDKVKTKHFQCQPQATLVNEYGPTETTVWSSLKIFEKATESVTIGRPAPHVSLYVLAKDRSQCPVGVVGELYVGGVGLAKGYLNRPELTAERFIDHVDSKGNSERLYRTGDLVKVLPSGEIAYIGRNDFQVKLRGFRLELGEIENCIRANFDVADVVVCVRLDDKQRQSLVAYLVAPSMLDIREQRDKVERILPEFMWPSFYVLLPEMPLTENGKVNRKALPAPSMENIAEEPFTPPETTTEKQLAELFHRELGLERINIVARFVQLGIHSLQFVKLGSVIREELKIELSVKDFYVYDTLFALAQYVEHQLTEQQKQIGEEREVVEL